jgi:hypothetical protein
MPMRTPLPVAIALLVATAVHAQDAPELGVPIIGENLIHNGSFELSPLGPVPAGEVPEGWANEAYGADGQLTIVGDAAPGEGAQSVQVTVTEDNNKSGLHGEFIEIDPTQAYIQFGWLKIGEDSSGYGLSYGRQWFDVEKQGADQEHSRSYNYAPKPEPIPGRWGFTKQILLPDPDPDDGAFAAHQIPSNARYLKIWALAYNWVGTGSFDGLSLYRVDYASMAREQILAAMDEADADAMRAEVEEALADVPDDHPLRVRTGDLLAELARVRREAVQEEQRPVLDWMADEERIAGLLHELDTVRWEMKIEALLRRAG